MTRTFTFGPIEIKLRRLHGPEYRLGAQCGHALIVWLVLVEVIFIRRLV